MKRPTLARPPAGSDLSLATRAFAVLAAVFMVSAVAMAALLPTEFRLISTIQAVRPVSHAHLQQVVTRVAGRFAWQSVVDPVLERPVWLLPFSLGLICVGGVVTSLSPTAPRTTKRRS